MLFDKINNAIKNIDINTLGNKREVALESLIDYIQEKHNKKEDILLNFICTHNSRRSHLSQIWAQTMASFFDIKNVYCYSGGTESTKIYPMVIETMESIGFEIKKLSEGNNSIYSIKYNNNDMPIIGFSKSYNDSFNPKSNYAAIMVCSSADEACPVVNGCEKRISLTFDDPKDFDNSPLQKEKYLERSIEIATNLYYVFSKIKK